MKIFPKSISHKTKIAIIAIGILALLLSLIAGKYFLLIFVTILAGPFSFLGFHFGFFGVIPAGRVSLLTAILYSFGMGSANIFLILSHSYKQNSTTMFLTLLGCFIWFFWGMAVAFVGV